MPPSHQSSDSGSRPSPYADRTQLATAGGLAGGVVGELLALLLWLNVTLASGPSVGSPWLGWLGVGATDLGRFFPQSESLALGLGTVGGFALIGLALGALVGALGLPWLRTPGRVAGCVVGGLVASWLFAAAAAHGQLDGLGGIPLDHPARLRRLVLDLLLATAVGGGLGGLAGRLTAGWRPRRSVLVWAGLLPLAFVVASGFFPLADPEPNPGTETTTVQGSTNELSIPEVSTPDGAIAAPDSPKIVVLGLDGLSWRVLGPEIAAGQLPNFAELVRRGAWGPLMTYGTASSPRVWTSLATGQRVRIHGIDDFVRAQGGYRASPLTSADRRAPALWNLLSAKGQRVAVINWLTTHPPEQVNGVMVTRVANQRPETYPPELAGQLRALASTAGTDRTRSPQAARLWTLDRIFDVAEELLDQPAPAGDFDLLMLYDNAADSAQHQHWRDHEPEAFDAAVWGEPDPDRADWIVEVYRRLDTRIGRLLERLDPDTLVFVVSDHGQKAARHPRVRLQVDRLLAELGYLELTPNGQPRHRRSRAYPLVETLWTPTVRVNLNLRGRERHGVVPASRADALLDRLEKDLAGLRFDGGWRGGSPLFARIERAASLRTQGQGPADLRLLPTARLQQPSVILRALEIAGQSLPAADFLTLDRSISGEHDHRGILLVHGPGVRPGLVGQRSLTTPFHRLLWHLTDKVDAVDTLLPPLRHVGLLDPATTLDLTPTVLWLQDQPVGRDMAGRVLRELFTRSAPVATRDTYQDFRGGGYPVAKPDENTPSPNTPEADREMLERLRALGYVG